MGHSKTYVVILALLAMLGTSWAGQANKALMDTPKNKSQNSLPKEEVDNCSKIWTAEPFYFEIIDYIHAKIYVNAKRIY